MMGVQKEAVHNDWSRLQTVSTSGQATTNFPIRGLSLIQILNLQDGKEV